MADIINSPVGTMPTIPVDSGGKFTPGAAYAIDSAAQIINAAWNLGLDQRDAFIDKVDTLAADIASILAAEAQHIAASTASVPTIAEPVVSIPAAIDTSSILATFDAESTALIAEFAGKVTSFLTEYFPNDQGNYDAAEAWLTSALANPHGLPTAVAAQLYTDEHDKHVAEATRAKDALFTNFAARRFPLPPGALASATLQIDQKAQDLSAETGRKLTGMSVEQLRWAAEKVVGLRAMAQAAALDYAKLMVQGPTVAASVTGIGYDAQTKLIGAVSSFYGARTEAAKVITAADQFNASATQDAEAKNQAADLTLIEDRVKAMMVEVQAIAQMATSLFNNVHAAAGSSYSVSA